MVDVNLKIDEYAAFPTMIYKFESDLFDEHLKMIEYIKNQPMTMEGMIQTKDNLFKLEEFKSLVEIVQNITANILKNLKIENYITCQSIMIKHVHYILDNFNITIFLCDYTPNLNVFVLYFPHPCRVNTFKIYYPRLYL